MPIDTHILRIGFYKYWWDDIEHDNDPVPEVKSKMPAGKKKKPVLGEFEPSAFDAAGRVTKRKREVVKKGGKKKHS